MSLSSAWEDFKDSTEAWDQSLRDNFWSWVEGEKVVDQIEDTKLQDDARKVLWRNVLEKANALDKKVCEIPYQAFALGMGPGLWAMYVSIWYTGPEVTGVREYEIPRHWSDRIIAKNASPITEAEYTAWRLEYGCPAPAPATPPATTNGGGGTPAPGAGGTPAPSAGAWLAQVAPQSTAGKLALVGVGGVIVFGVLYILARGKKGKRR